MIRGILGKCLAKAQGSVVVMPRIKKNACRKRTPAGVFVFRVKRALQSPESNLVLGLRERRSFAWKRRAVLHILFYGTEAALSEPVSSPRYQGDCRFLLVSFGGKGERWGCRPKPCLRD